MRILSLALFAVLCVALTMGVTTAAVADEVQGTLNFVQSDDQTFTFTERDGNEHTMSLEVTGEVLINDQVARLEDLNEGDEISVTFEERDGMKIASLIVSNR